MVGRIIAVLLNGPANQFDRRFMAAELGGNDPEQMQSLGMTGHSGENPPVMRLRLTQAPGPMVCRARLQQLANATLSSGRHGFRRRIPC